MAASLHRQSELQRQTVVAHGVGDDSSIKLAFVSQLISETFDHLAVLSHDRLSAPELLTEYVVSLRLKPMTAKREVAADAFRDQPPAEAGYRQHVHCGGRSLLEVLSGTVAMAAQKHALGSNGAEKDGDLVLNSIPAVHPRFQEFLEKHPEKDFTAASIANIKSRLNRARRLLYGRTYADLALELAALEDTAEFAALDVRTKSDLRAALRLHHEFVGTLSESKFARKQAKVSAREQWGVGRRPSVIVPTPEAASSTTPAATGPSVLRRRRPVPDAPVPEGDPYLEADMKTYDPRHEPSAITRDGDDGEYSG